MITGYEMVFDFLRKAEYHFPQVRIGNEPVDDQFAISSYEPADSLCLLKNAINFCS